MFLLLSYFVSDFLGSSQAADNSTDLEVRVTLLENDVTVLQDEVEEMETDINQLDDGLLLVQGNVDDNSNDIEGNRKRQSITFLFSQSAKSEQENLFINSV